MPGVHLAREKRNQLAGLLAAHFARWEPVQQAGKHIDGGRISRWRPRSSAAIQAQAQRRSPWTRPRTR